MFDNGLEAFRVGQDDACGQKDTILDLADLVGRCRNGDALAWETLVRRFQARVFGLSCYYAGNREDARDLAQEIFVRIYQNLGYCRDDAAFVPWMLILGRNCCIDWLRRQKNRGPAKNGYPGPKEPLDPGADPEESMEIGTRKRLIFRALAMLSLHSREMILLKEIQGLKINEISEILDIPPGTVKSRFGRARVELAKAVLKLDPSYGVRS